MKKPVVEFPLSKEKVLINIDQPCFYCGKPVPDCTEKWQTKLIYQMKYWGLTKQLGNWQLGDLIDANGNKKLGEVVLNVSYCPEHIEVPLAIKKIRSLRKVLNILLPVIFLGGFLWFFFIQESTKYTGDNQLLYLILFSPTMIILGLLVAGLIAEFQRWWILRTQFALKDFELNGHWGIHSAYIETDQGKMGVGPITYCLRITCSNLSLAERLKVAYPQAHII